MVRDQLVKFLKATPLLGARPMVTTKAVELSDLLIVDVVVLHSHVMLHVFHKHLYRIWHVSLLKTPETSCQCRLLLLIDTGIYTHHF